MSLKEHFHKIKSKMGANNFLDSLADKAALLNSRSRKVIVFPELDTTVLKACSIVLKKGIAIPLIIGEKQEIEAMLNREHISNIKEQHMIDHLDDKNRAQLESYAREFMEMRKKDGKEVTLDEARDLMCKPHYYGTMLVHKGVADGMVSGIYGQTKPYLPAFQIIKTRHNVPRASGLFIMQRGSEVYFYADSALNINPTAEELAAIALTTADTASRFGLEPRVAMLSFSTRDSAKHEMVDKVKNATRIVREKSPELLVDGELQADAAIVPEVMMKKCKDSILQGRANVLIFPDLNSGNIAYKLTERLAGFTAVGPIMQGLNKPINDLSRGASVNDVVLVTVITVMQTV